MVAYVFSSNPNFDDNKLKFMPDFVTLSIRCREFCILVN